MHVPMNPNPLLPRLFQTASGKPASLLLRRQRHNLTPKHPLPHQPAVTAVGKKQEQDAGICHIKPALYPY